MKFVIIFFTLSLTANSFAANSCKSLQNKCNHIQAEYTEALQVWDGLDYKNIPKTIASASNKWSNCLALKEKNGCNKKAL